jgi:hypothetical protein
MEVWSNSCFMNRRLGGARSWSLASTGIRTQDRSAQLVFRVLKLKKHVAYKRSINTLFYGYWILLKTEDLGPCLLILNRGGGRQLAWRKQQIFLRCFKTTLNSVSHYKWLLVFIVSFVLSVFPPSAHMLTVLLDIFVFLSTAKQIVQFIIPPIHILTYYTYS